MDKVLILGIDGFTGHHVQQYIHSHRLTERFDIVGCSRTPVAAPFPIEIVQATDRQAIAGVLKTHRPEYIINLIGTPQPQTLEATVLLNATISQWLCEIIIKEKLPIKKLLAIGSAAEYGYVTALPILETTPLAPVSHYGLAKAWQSQLLQFYHRQAQVPITIARTFNIVGTDLPPYLSMGSFMEQIRNAADQAEIYAGNIHSRRDYLDIDDVVDAYWKLLINGPAGEVFNVCSGQSQEIGTLLQHLIDASGKELRLVVDPKLVRTNDQPDVFGDNSKLRQAVDWQPTHDVLETLAAGVYSAT